MTKQEAIEAMQKGEKVTHRFFDIEEWITMIGNRIFTEEGYSASPVTFWGDRCSIQWESDWEIFQPNKPNH